MGSGGSRKGNILGYRSVYSPVVDPGMGGVGRGGCKEGNIRGYRSVYSPVVDPGVGWGEEDVEKEILEATGRYILQWWIQGEGWVGRGGCRKGNIRGYRSVYSPVVDPGVGGVGRGGCRKGNIRGYRLVYPPVVDPGEGWLGERRV